MYNIKKKTYICLQYHKMERIKPDYHEEKNEHNSCFFLQVNVFGNIQIRTNCNLIYCSNTILNHLC